MCFDGYIDARWLVYTRNMLDGSGRIESVAAHLVTADEVVLLTGNATEVSVAPDGPLEDFVLLNARACRPRGS